MDKTVSTFSILSGFKARHIIHLLNFFFLIQGDGWRGKEEVVSYAALFPVVVLREDRHKK